MYRVTHRCFVSGVGSMSDHLVPTSIPGKYTLSGVPGNKCDVLISDRLSPDWAIVLEIGKKEGKYNGALRTRFSFRKWSRNARYYNGPGNNQVVIQHDTISVIVNSDKLIVAGRTFTAIQFDRLKSNLDGYTMSSVIMWHWNRYFKFLPHRKVLALANTFERNNPALRQGTLAEANRLANRDLHKLANDLGWHKLTLKEQKRYGQPEWVISTR